MSASTAPLPPSTGSGLPGGVLNFDAQPHLFAVWGWATALDELQYQYRIIPEWKLTSDTLSTLKVLIIPNSEVFNASDVTTLTTWVNGGGILIVTGDSGSLQGESGNFASNSTLALSSLTGVTNMTGAPTTKTQKSRQWLCQVHSDANYGLTFWNDTTTTLRSGILNQDFGTEMSTELSATGQHVALTSNAPNTAGLTLYQDTQAMKLFLDVNNENITIAGSNPLP